LVFNSSQLKRNSRLSIGKGDASNINVILPDFSGSGSYGLMELYSKYARIFSPFKIPIALDTELGITELTSLERGNNLKKLQPRLLVSLTYKNSFSKIMQGEIKIEYKQTPPALMNLATEVFPAGFAAFRQTANVFLPVKAFSASYQLDFSFKDYSSLAFNVNVDRQFTNYVNTQSFDFLSSIFKDSAVNAPISNVSAFTRYDFPFVPLGIKVKLNNTMLVSGFLANTNQRLETLRFFLMRNSLELVRKLNRRSTLNFRYGNQLSKNITRADVQKGFLGQTINSNVQLALKQTFSETVSANLIVEWIRNTSAGLPNAEGFFSDIEIRKEITRKNIVIALKLENIANQKDYRVYNSYSALNQSLLTIPLIRRNIFMSATWSF
jgi:hypothetical protein